MTQDAAPHCGLPFVPQPARDELLGSWLLRIAEVYCLSLSTLLARLSARQDAGRDLPHWFALRASDLRLDALSRAARLSPEDLAAMAPPSCRPRWPQELGLCEDCLDVAATCQPIYWDRRWMHPLASICSIHGKWLTSVATRDLARIKSAAGLGIVAERSRSAQSSAGDAPACIDDALWLQNICSEINDERPSWGTTSRDVVIRIVDVVAHALMGVNAADSVYVGYCIDRSFRSVISFKLEAELGQQIHLTLPTRLRQRQHVLASVGHVLRHGPQARHETHGWPPSVVKKLAGASTKHWPAAALAWICPRAAELVRRQDELRGELGISPRYFQACSALFNAVA